MAKNYVSNKDESVPLFDNKLLDKFTYVHPVVPVAMYIPLIAYVLYYTLSQQLMTVGSMALLFVGGIAAWTLFEYIAHRYVFHYEPKSNFGQYIHHLIHGVHHDYPNDSRRLVMPPVVSVPLAIIFYGFYRALLGDAGLPVFAGFVFGYLCYDMIHYATHHFPMNNRVGLWLKHHHIRHHYEDEELGFGVSSPIWDYVFGTRHREIKKNKTRKTSDELVDA